MINDDEESKKGDGEVDHWTLIWLAYVALPACFACGSDESASASVE